MNERVTDIVYEVRRRIERAEEIGLDSMQNDTIGIIMDRIATANDRMVGEIIRLKKHLADCLDVISEVRGPLYDHDLHDLEEKCNGMLLLYSERDEKSDTEHKASKRGELASKLREYNAWRRGEGKYGFSEDPTDPDKNADCPMTPKELGEVIENVVEFLERGKIL